jgi:hypothetical protein
MNLLEARSSFSLNKRRFETLGAVFPDVTQFVPDGWGEDIGLAMDAQPGLSP